MPSDVSLSPYSALSPPTRPGVFNKLHVILWHCSYLCLYIWHLFFCLPEMYFSNFSIWWISPILEESAQVSPLLQEITSYGIISIFFLKRCSNAALLLGILHIIYTSSLKLPSLQGKWLFPTFFFFQVLEQCEKVGDEKFHCGFSNCG
jgi:hypothetical protein